METEAKLKLSEKCGNLLLDLMEVCSDEKDLNKVQKLKEFIEFLENERERYEISIEAYNELVAVFHTLTKLAFKIAKIRGDFSGENILDNYWLDFRLTILYQTIPRVAWLKSRALLFEAKLNAEKEGAIGVQCPRCKMPDVIMQQTKIVICKHCGTEYKIAEIS